MADAADLRALADRQAITDLIHRYCRAVDRLDVRLGRSIWHEDGYADYGTDYYQGPGKGVIDRICENHLATLHHSHQVSNVLIDLDGDRAGSEAYCTASLRVMQGETLMQITVWSRYIDSWSRRKGRWGLDRRVAVRDFDEIREVDEMKRHETGTRDRNDPSYAVLRDPG
jgi:SnoaL-like domain